MQYESLKRYVFRQLLNAVTVLDDRMSTGRLFHASGPATTNARLPNSTPVYGTRKSPWVAEWSDLRVDRLFHTSGPATTNARLPNSTLVYGTRKSPWVAEWSDLRVDMVAMGLHMFHTRGLSTADAVFYSSV